MQIKPESVEKTVYNNLVIIHQQSSRMLESFDRYCRCDDERLKDDLLESINSRINHISQAFRDIMAFIEIAEKGTAYEESLRYYVRQYFKRGIPKTENEKKAVDFLTKRNNLVHDYFSIDQINFDLVKNLSDFGDGFSDIAKNIKDYCIQNFPELALGQDLEKTLKSNIRKK
nr:hypothetical protein [uncultured Schaedlerella sp.]